MTLGEFSDLASAGASIATVIALMIGAYWTYIRFIKQREDFAFVEFTVDFCFLGKQGGWWIVELIANLENKGKVVHEFRDLSFDLAALFGGDPVVEEQRFGGQAFFPHVLARGPWPPEDEYYIEPGTRARYSYVARVPEAASFLMLHGKFTYTYLDKKHWHKGKRTVKVPGGETVDQSLNG